MHRALPPAGLLLLCFLLAAPLPAPAPIFVKLPGIPGESTNKNHSGEIEIQSWSWGATNPAAKPAWRDLLLTKNTDQSTPRLLNALCTGRSLSNAVITLTPHPSSARDYYRLELSGVQITSLTLPASAEETFTLSFSKLQIQYLLLAGDTPIYTSQAYWDLATNTGAEQNWQPPLRATLTFDNAATTGTLTWNSKPNTTYKILSSPNPAGPYKTHTTLSSGSQTTLSITLPFDLNHLFLRIQETQ